MIGAWLVSLWIKIIGFFSSDKQALSMKRLVSFIVTIRFATYSGDSGEYIWAMVSLIVILLGAGSFETVASLKTQNKQKKQTEQLE